MPVMLYGKYAFQLKSFTYKLQVFDEGNDEANL